MQETVEDTDGRKDPLDGKNVVLETIRNQASKPVTPGHEEGSETKRESVENDGPVNLILLKI